jgi:hypothetical protein
MMLAGRPPAGGHELQVLDQLGHLLVDQQQAARGELGRPGGEGRRWVGEVAEQQAAGEQVGRRARERGPGHVVDGEGHPRRRVRGGQGDERRRLVEAEGASRTQDRGQQAGGVAGAAARSTARPGWRPAKRARNGWLAGAKRSASRPRRRAAGAESPKA